MSSTPLAASGPRPRTAWKDRVKALESAAGVSRAGLGELVEAELSRCDGVLFTATPAEELDEISRWARLGDAVWCGQVRAIVAAHNRMSPTEREFLSCEVALALSLSDGSAEDLIAVALRAASAPGLVESVEAGMLSVRHVYAVLGGLEGCGLSAEEECAVVTIALARYTDQTPAQLKQLVSKLILQVEPAAAAARETDKTAHRYVRVRAVENGQGVLTARGPLAVIEAIRAALGAGAQQGSGDPEDRRNREARELDLLGLLVTGWLPAYPDNPNPVVPDGKTGPAGPAGAWQPTIVVPYSVAAGDDVELAEIPGLGPVLPETARELLQGAVTVTRIAVDADGHVLDVTPGLPGPAACVTEADPTRWLRELTEFPVRIGIPEASRGYQPSARLRRYLEARDKTCVFPGCTRPASTTDKDHRLAFPLGITDAYNLHCLCRRHHRAKQAVFTVITLPDGTTRWITRGGWWFDRQPQGY